MGIIIVATLQDGQKFLSWFSHTYSKYGLQLGEMVQLKSAVVAAENNPLSAYLKILRILRTRFVLLKFSYAHHLFRECR
jgi:hypothetical protein